jgi:hypothetical protein
MHTREQNDAIFGPSIRVFRLMAAAKEEFCASAISQVGQGKPDLKLTKPQKLNYEQPYDDERTVDFSRHSLANSTGARPDLQMCLCRSGRT